MLLQNIGTIIRASATICAILMGADDSSDYSPSSPSSIINDNNVGTQLSYERFTINDGIARLGACKANSNCVSSNYREPPNRYVSTFKIVNEPGVAFQRAARDLKQEGNGISVLEIVPSAYYIHVTVPGTAPASLDDIELVFSNDIVSVKCEARVTLPPPPFCIRKNCITGNMVQRSRIERLGNVLGLPSSDRDEMQGAKWTPIFSSDRVPGFDDDV
jgi:uncharacterized protein (DUF1499 family)